MPVASQHFEHDHLVPTRNPRQRLGTESKTVEAKDLIARRKSAVRGGAASVGVFVGCAVVGGGPREGSVSASLLGAADWFAAGEGGVASGGA